jgi:hypothetical protein
MREVKNKPTKEETTAAVQMQAPVQNVQSEDKPPVQRVNTFQQLARVSRDSRIALGGGTAQWIQPEMLFSEYYREGLESIPFFITRAWRFKSKSGYGERLGIEIALSNGRIYSVAFPWNDNDEKRKDILAMFEQRNAPPIGPVCVRKLPKDKGHDYYDIAAYDNSVRQGETIDIPFVEINDADVPF